jgi:BirA family biotin operon repressor/biotin-[acetyl-CoA-carboxylase] ligase
MLSAADWAVKAKFCSMVEQAEVFGERLQGLLRTDRFGRQARVLASVPSTQDEARRLAREGSPEGQLVWALEQTAGRGRMDRTWSSPSGAGLWFSVVLRPILRAGEAGWLTLAAGVGVATALRRLGAADVRLKWPNDVLLNGGKLAGILAEGEVAGEGMAFAILGVGVNLRRPPEGFEASIRPPPATLADSVIAAAAEPAGVLAQLLADLEAAYDLLAAGRSAELRRRWLEVADTVGRRVRAELAEGVVEGVAVDLSEDGALVLELADRRRVPVRSGEIIHLR